MLIYWCVDLSYYRRQSVSQSREFGNNRFGRAGTFRCRRCRKWRIKVRLQFHFLILVSASTRNWTFHAKAAREGAWHAAQTIKFAVQQSKDGVPTGSVTLAFRLCQQKLLLNRTFLKRIKGSMSRRTAPPGISQNNFFKGAKRDL